jgi:hypothetical protein
MHWQALVVHCGVSKFGVHLRHTFCPVCSARPDGWVHVKSCVCLSRAVIAHKVPGSLVPGVVLQTRTARRSLYRLAGLSMMHSSLSILLD